MAGNIIPAIATTNAIIAGLIVMEGLKVVSGELESCRMVRPQRHTSSRVHLTPGPWDARALGSVDYGMDAVALVPV